MTPRDARQALEMVLGLPRRLWPGVDGAWIHVPTVEALLRALPPDVPEGKPERRVMKNSTIDGDHFAQMHHGLHYEFDSCKKAHGYGCPEATPEDAKAFKDQQRMKEEG